MFILWGVHREHFLYSSLCNIGQVNVRLILLLLLIIIVTIIPVLLILIIIDINIAKKNLMKIEK